MKVKSDVVLCICEEICDPHEVKVSDLVLEVVDAQLYLGTGV